MSKFFIYAIIVSVVTSGSSWMRAMSGGSNYNSGYRGSTWSSHTGGGGGSYGGGSGGGGHK
ncbi:hypothetical protein [Duganella sp. Dugasp56]|jgi:hypothetical protein|uniref:hypothetical protein n=1 Tax=unclassified Duganella TaxID=2636909 RepID=UPI00159E3CC2